MRVEKLECLSRLPLGILWEEKKKRHRSCVEAGW